MCPRVFLFLADIHLYVYVAPVPLSILFAVYKLGVMKILEVCVQDRVIVLA